ncbi:MAG: hypothetical protein JW810_00065 [Sedimentisphaerales bacterium]|nr:hypothetical protein [Sedimentisphaerales bacterium]
MVRRSTQWMFSVCILAVLLIGSTGCDKEPSGAEARPIESPYAPPPMIEGDFETVQPIRQEQEFTEPVSPQRAPREITLTCRQTSRAPRIDGVMEPDVWSFAEEITTLDGSSQRPITLRALHDGETIYILASYPDAAASTTHKSWTWDEAEHIYKPGPDREDAFVIKWLMQGESMSLQPDRCEPHTADIWFWKACRTNPAGYLDDKRHEVSLTELPDSLAIPSARYGRLYLGRPADAGRSAYEERMPYAYAGDCVRKFYPRPPEGSRADVRAQGIWSQGTWTLEAARKLDTAQDDDIRLTVPGRFILGVSLYEMAATGVEPQWTQPLYRTGDVFDRIILQIP